MDDEILFTEKQRFKQWWLWIILIGINVLFLFGVFKQVIVGQQFGNKPMSNSGLIITALLTMLFTLLFLNFQLETKIKKMEFMFAFSLFILNSNTSPGVC
jgi:uncharacterized membrane protein